MQFNKLKTNVLRAGEIFKDVIKGVEEDSR